MTNFGGLLHGKAEQPATHDVGGDLLASDEAEHPVVGR